MRLLLDENLDWRLRRDLLAHQVESVPLIGWAGIENGELLRKAVEAGFDALITMDSSMVHQQKIERYAIAVVALRAASNRLADTRPLMPALLALLSRINSGTVTFLPSPQVSNSWSRRESFGRGRNELLEKSATGKVERRWLSLFVAAMGALAIFAPARRLLRYTLDFMRLTHPLQRARCHAS